MHTDQGSAAGSHGQTLMLTALFYLNPDWQEGDGGELRVFPYPYAARRIPPVEGRMVLFEPRMVHDVLPNYKKRFCFTLWCNQKGLGFSRQIDHHTLKELEVDVNMFTAAARAEGWRRGERVPLAYDQRLPRPLRHLFLPEMRCWLVRTAHMADELAQVSQSHVESHVDQMVQGISAHHDMIRTSNPKWALDLVEQIPAAAECGSRPDAGLDIVQLPELRDLIHRSCPWWI